MSLTTKEITVTADDGMILHGKFWYPPPNVTTKARILFIHGFSEFTGAYDTWFPRVVNDGYEVLIYDQRGFGKTGKDIGKLGLSSEAHVMSDLEAIVKYTMQDYTGKLIMWGFSMGGAICLNYMVIGKQKSKFDLYLAGGPCIEIGPVGKGNMLNRIKMSLLPYLVKISPNYTETVPLEPRTCTDNPENWELYYKQEYRSTKTSSQYMNDAINRGKRLLDPKFISSIVDKPLLISQGLGDIVCDPEAAAKFYEIVKLSDKQYDTYPNQAHEILNSTEQNKAQTWKNTKQWLDKHLQTE